MATTTRMIIITIMTTGMSQAPLTRSARLHLSRRERGIRCMPRFSLSHVEGEGGISRLSGPSPSRERVGVRAAPRGRVAHVFDAYVMVDWSAAAVPATGADSIWIASAERRDGALPPPSLDNPPTRRRRHRRCSPTD